MNIDEIRAEIPKAFELGDLSVPGWLKGQGEILPDSVNHVDATQVAVQILVDWAYEAGVKRGGEISLSALNEVELRENPIYQKGYEAGKDEGYDQGYDTCYTGGYNAAAKDPKAWYVLDKHGEQVHIGDTAKNEFDHIVDIVGFSLDFDSQDMIVWKEENTIHYSFAAGCEKVTPDSWEQWQGDLVERLHHANKEAPEPSDDYWDYFEGIAEEFKGRAEKLAEVDA